MIIPVILSGGHGSRLWPLSRSMYPKQLLALMGEKTMLQQTMSRIKKADKKIVVCQETHRFLVQEQLSAMGCEDVQIILEPCSRNTAPAIALAAWQQYKIDKFAKLLIMPADHIVTDSTAFNELVELACKNADDNNLVTFGIKPNYPETGYGYIKAGEQISKNCMNVDCFVEKPNFQVAEKYVESGNYYWNSGIFLFKANVFLQELEKYEPQIYQQTKMASEQSSVDNQFIRPDETLFKQCPNRSIDYAVMEKTKLAVVKSADFGWSDIGSWKSLWKASEKDENNNVVIGDVLTHDSHNCYIHADHRLVTTVNTKDLTIVETADAVLVAENSSAEEVKNLVSALKDQSRPETNLHRKVYRPWGSFEGVDIDDKFQVKRITVKPGGKLSLQKHKYRSEHWVVVNGEATVTRDTQTLQVNENESIYIPLGALHRLENKKDSPLELIEVQTGTYFGEDDIIRIDDVYGRDEKE